MTNPRRYTEDADGNLMLTEEAAPAALAGYAKMQAGLPFICCY